MEQGKSPEVSRLIDKLEELGRAQLEYPDGIDTNISYQFSLPDTYHLQLEDRSSTEVPGTLRANHTTAIFVNRFGELHDETHCSTQLAFSLLYNHIDRKLHGVQFVSPIDLPQNTLTNNDQENEAFERLLSIAAWIYDRRPMTVDDPIYEGHFDFDQDQLEKGTVDQLLSPLLLVTNGLLASGSFYERRYKSVTSGRASAWVESNIITGPKEHATRQHPDRVGLCVRRSVDKLQYSFEQLEDGSFEIKVRIADHAERYRHYRTFQPTVDNEGKVVAFNLNADEIAEKEAEDRAMGIFEPTVEKLELLLEPFLKAA